MITFSSTPFVFSADPYLHRLLADYPTWLFDDGWYYPLDSNGKVVEWVSSDAAPLGAVIIRKIAGGEQL